MLQPCVEKLSTFELPCVAAAQGYIFRKYVSFYCYVDDKLINWMSLSHCSLCLTTRRQRLVNIVYPWYNWNDCIWKPYPFGWVNLALLLLIVYWICFIWFENLSLRERNSFSQKMKWCSRLIGESQLSLESLYTRQLQRIASSILSDDSRPHASEFQYLPSCRRLRVPRSRSFVLMPASLLYTGPVYRPSTAFSLKSCGPQLWHWN